jgi:hypothetical protein
MRRLLLIISCFPLLVAGQYTFVPDDNFEQALINLGYDFLLDDNVETTAIDTISYLAINGLGISDLTGIEDFISLSELFCYSNQLSSLNLSNNTQLFEVSCSNNQLTYIDIRNGNNPGLWYFQSINNPELDCIDVDDLAWANINWSKDSWTTFSLSCTPTDIKDYNGKRRLIKILDIFGRNIIPKPNMPLFYIYSDGTTEKKLIIK